MTPILRCGIQKSGRLNSQSLSLLSECGVDIDTSGKSGSLRVQAGDFPLEVYFFRDDDIPGYIRDGVVDIGILGQNIVVESGNTLSIAERLGFARCRLSLAVPRGSSYKSVHDLAGKKIATSYSRTLEGYLRKKGVSASIHSISGSVEIAPGIGIADAICDLVSSGSTLLSNGLVEIEKILESEAVLVARDELLSSDEDEGSFDKLSDEDKERAWLLARLRFRIQSVLRAKRHKYIVLNAPNDALQQIADILPGVKSPTIIPLAESGWSAVHSVVIESTFWEVIENLRAVGAQGILVVPIEKIVLS